MSLSSWLVCILLLFTLSLGAQPLQYARAMVDSAQVYMDQKKLKPALEYLRTARATFQKIKTGTDFERGNVAIKIGVCHYNTGQRDSSVIYWKDALGFLSNNDSLTVEKRVGAFNNLSVALTALGKHDDAIFNAKTALRIMGKRFPTHDGVRYSQRYVIVGNAFRSKNELDSALVYYDKSRSALALVENSKKKAEVLGRVLLAQANLYRDLGDKHKAVELQKEALNLLETYFALDDEWVVRARQNLAVSYASVGDLNRSEQIHLQNIGIVEKRYGSKNIFIANTFTNLSDLSNRKGDYKGAIRQLNAAIAAIPYPKSSQKLLGYIYNKLGANYLSSGDAVRGMNAYQRSLQIRKKLLPANHPVVAATINNIAGALSKLNRQSEAVDKYAEAIGLLEQSLPSDHEYLIQVKASYANALSGVSRLPEARSILLKQLDIVKSGTNSRPGLESIVMNYLSKPQLWLHQLDSAKYYALIAIKLLEEQVDPKIKTLCLAYKDLGDIARIQGDNSLFQKAETKYCALHGVGEDTDWSTVQAPVDYLVWSYRRLKYRIENYKQVPSEENFYVSMQLVKEVTACSRYLRGRGIYPPRLLDVERYVYQLVPSVLLEKIRLDQNPSHLQEALLFSDICNSRKMSLALRSAELANSIDLPGGLTLLEDSIKTMRHELSTLEGRIRRGETPPPTGEYSVVSRRESIIQLEKTWLTQLDQLAPQYFTARFAEPEFTVAEVRDQLLNPNRAILSYLITDSVAYTFLLRTDTLIAHQQPLTEARLNTLVRRFVDVGINGFYGTNKTERTDSLRLASLSSLSLDGVELYRLLIAPLEEQLPEELVIIPDGPLSALPFAALSRSAPLKEGAWKSYSFLFKEHTLSYAFSIDQQLRMVAAEAKGTGWWGLAPFASQSSGTQPASQNRGLLWSDPQLPLSNLLQSGPEVEQIAVITSGKVLLKDQAHREALRMAASRTGVLHLATHSIPNDRSPRDAFLALAGTDSNGYDPLRAEEIYGLKLSAEMVVLSACESGVGRLLRGEGAQSLERAFAYAGAKSLVSSLWAANDKRTSELMVAFYRNLREGQPRAVALHLAMKSVYLSPTEGAQPPFFWAGWMLRGDNGLLDLN